MKTLNHSDIIAMWGTPAALAADLGVKKNTVRGWKARNSIPDDYWPELVNKARERSRYITFEMLAYAAAERRVA